MIDECPIRPRPEFLQAGDVEFASDMASSLLSQELATAGVMQVIAQTVAEITVILVRNNAPLEASACRALAVADLIMQSWAQQRARTMNYEDHR